MVFGLVDEAVDGLFHQTDLSHDLLVCAQDFFFLLLDLKELKLKRLDLFLRLFAGLLFFIFGFL